MEQWLASARFMPYVDKAKLAGNKTRNVAAMAFFLRLVSGIDYPRWLSR
tara:strand:- start:407 stop:553 length:147 start_codon:yes stop_codon:yes gene_type:complete